MIADASVFGPDYRPQRLLYRDGEQNTLGRAFEPALDGERADDVLLHGPQGVGKTVLVQHLLDRLDKRADIQFATVRCLGLSKTGILRATLQDLVERDIAQNTPHHDICIYLRETIDQPTIVVLDEADDIPASDVLAHLRDLPLVSVVVICHDDERWLERLDIDQRRPWHDAVNLRLDRYATPALADILEPRAEKGLRRGAVGRDQLEAIADEAAGSARRAITALHATADVATERGHEQIRAGDIPAGLERGQRWVRRHNLSSLPMHHHVLYELIRQAGAIDGATLHDRYDAVAEDVYHGEKPMPVTKRMRRYHLDKLEEYDLIEQDGTYRVLDPSVRSPLNLPTLRADH